MGKQPVLDTEQIEPMMKEQRQPLEITGPESRRSKNWLKKLL